MARLLNEQLERLRELVRKAYGAVADKGGIVPEAGERNMSNLPDAVRSIPQEHTELTELTITANGEYSPADYDVDGFSKVTANFDTSSLPKVKVSALKVTNDCINEDGTWSGGSFIDWSKVTDMSGSFYGCNNLIYLNSKNWNTYNVKSYKEAFRYINDMSGYDFSGIKTDNAIDLSYMFAGSRYTGILDLSHFNTNKVTDFNNFMYATQGFRIINLGYWDMSSAIKTTMFNRCDYLINIIGGKTLDNVLQDNISTCNNLRVSMTLSGIGLDTASLRAIINGLADVNNQPAESRPTLTLGTTLLANLTDGDKVIATEKGWNLA